MEELKQFKTFLPVAAVLILIMGFVMLMGASSGDASQVAVAYFSVPFSDNVHYSITSPFGYRKNPLNESETTFHSAIDMSAPEGTNILASADGIVVSASYEEAGGWVVVIDHKFDGVIYQTVYAHMLEESVVVTVGEAVSKGQKIGVIGMTGSQVTGVHLHFGIFSPDRSKNEFAIDPIYVIKK